MPKLTINNQLIEVPEDTTVLQAAQLLGIEIPVFCYHSRLPIAGNCRMCLVQVGESTKPIASCAMPATEGMVIHTNTPFIQKTRKSVLEFLLINHPLDCPICDQGGECDLQDITMAYGPSTSRFQENKRAIQDKYMGPLIQTSMTRCIHCTRCVRFATEIAGVAELGTVGRGEDMEITSYLDQAITSELSGNMIDLCPVGALTSKPYAFKGRPWDLTKTESIDVLDAVGSNIRIDTYKTRVIRILPSLHEDINEEWISDKTRFACDGLSRQRLDQPYVRKNGKLVPASWDEALEMVQLRLHNVPGQKIAALAGDLVDCEAMIALKDLMHVLGSPHLDCRQDGAQLDGKTRSEYLFNTTISGIERSDFCLIIQSQLRAEAPLIHARLRKRYLQGNFKVAYLGGALPHNYNFSFDYDNYGQDPSLLEAILQGRHPLSLALKEAKFPMIIVGQEALTRQDGAHLLEKTRCLAEQFNMVRPNWNGFNVLHKAAARVGGLDVGFTPGKNGFDKNNILVAAVKGELEVIYLLGADEIDMNHLGKTFVIYQGHHGDAGAHRADVILPGAAYTEKQATYVNTEGRVQRTYPALLPPGNAKEDWKIIRALSQVLGKTLPYDSLEEIRNHLIQTNPIFSSIDRIQPAAWGKFGEEGSLSKIPFDSFEFNFHMTDSISRHSPTMAACVEILQKEAT
jgi:NADH-quinone oxidoreductase subunit G